MAEEIPEGQAALPIGGLKRELWGGRADPECFGLVYHGLLTVFGIFIIYNRWFSQGKTICQTCIPWSPSAGGRHGIPRRAELIGGAPQIKKGIYP